MKSTTLKLSKISQIVKLDIWVPFNKLTLSGNTLYNV
jgi:hypothetical protein